MPYSRSPPLKPRSLPAATQEIHETITERRGIVTIFRLPATTTNTMVAHGWLLLATTHKVRYTSNSTGKDACDSRCRRWRIHLRPIKMTPCWYARTVRELSYRVWWHFCVSETSKFPRIRCPSMHTTRNLEVAATTSTATRIVAPLVSTTSTTTTTTPATASLWGFTAKSCGRVSTVACANTCQHVWDTAYSSTYCYTCHHHGTNQPRCCEDGSADH